MKTIPQCVQQLLKIELRFLVKMEVIFREEREVLISFNPKSINNVTEKKLSLLKKMKRVNLIKQNLLLFISNELYGRATGLTLETVLISLKNTENWQEFEEILKKTDEVSKNIEELTKINRRLVNHALTTLNGVFDSVKKSFVKTERYTKKGMKVSDVEHGSIITGRV